MTDGVQTLPGPGESGARSPLPAGPGIMLFAARPSGRPREWQRFFLAIYVCACLVSVILGNIEFALCYAVLSMFFMLNSTDLDILAPMSMVTQAFGIYFLLPLALIDDRDPATLPYIACTLIAVLALYLLMPRLNFGLGWRLGRSLVFRKSFLRTTVVMQITGGIGFLISTRLAGFSNPFMVFADPIQYRFFMMVGGMTYFTEFLGFLIMMPAIVITVAYYMKEVSRAVFLTVVAAAALYGLATGARGSLILLVIQIFLIRHILYRRIGARLVLLLICVVVPFVAISGQYRQLKYTSANGSLQTVLSQLTIQDAVKLAFSRMDAAEMFNEFMVAERYHDPKLGMSYIEIVAEAIPRSFWKDKPRLPNPEMTRIIGRNDPYLDIAFDFGIFGETFLNFSWFGVIVGGAIVAIVGGSMQCIYDYAVSERSPVVILWVAVLCTVPLALVVSGLVEVSITAGLSILKVLAVRKLFFYRLPSPLSKASSAL